MTTAQELREQAKRIRESAQYCESGQDYRDEINRAAILERRADEMKTSTGSVESEK